MMFTIEAHVENGRVVVDEPLPEHVSDGMRVQVVVSDSSANSPPVAETLDVEEDDDALAQIERMGKALDHLDFPPDFAEQHKHYSKGLAKR